MIEKIIKYTIFASIAIIIVLFIYSNFFYHPPNYEVICMLKPGWDVHDIQSALGDYYSIPNRNNFPPSWEDLCRQSTMKDLCESYPSIEALNNNITIVLLNDKGEKITKFSSDRTTLIIRILYPDCKCPEEYQKSVPEWNNCVFTVKSVH